MSRSTWLRELLSTESVGEHLVARGLVEAGAPIAATELEGGVSNVVLAVDAPGLRAVVKQSLPKLRVKDDWRAKRERIVTEAEALRLVGAISPGAAPEVFDVDTEAFAIVIARAPDDWRNWKEELLAGTADPSVARRLGELLASWHKRTEGDPEVARRFSDLEAFEQLRVDPYHRTVIRRWSHLRRSIEGHVHALLTARTCLVHGDFSPKNVLVGEDGLWVVDFEVAHVGEPAFDVAFMLNHLMLKALHRPGDADVYRACALGFWESYQDASRPRIAFDRAHLIGHLGCLMLARVDGKSPAEYLTEPERLQARTVGSRLLLYPAESLEQAWERLDAAVDA